MAESANDILRQGIAAAKAGDKEQARRLLQQAIRLDPQSEAAWLWMASVAKDNRERIFCLRKILAINPNNEMAIKGLRALGASPEPETEQTVTVPLPDEKKLARAQNALDAIVAEYRALKSSGPQIEWVRKKGGRIGERSIAWASIGLITLGALIVLGIVGGCLALIIPRVSEMAARPTPTPYPTSTPTATPTPGLTPTPSPTLEHTYTPSPTYPPEVPAGTEAFGFAGALTRTPIPFRTPRADYPDMEDAIQYWSVGECEAALESIERARQVAREELPESYFYEGLCRAELGDLSRGEDALREGLAKADLPLLHAGLAYLALMQGEFDEAIEEAQTALSGDPMLVFASTTLARAYMAIEQYDEALREIERLIERRPYDVNLIVTRGEINLARGDPEAAARDAHLALYIDPISEPAHLLLARADLALGRYGAAVLDLQTYLHLFPGSIQGYALLGRARYMEGNLDMALEAYDRALSVRSSSPDVAVALIERGGMYMDRGRYEQAFEDFDRALRIMESPEAREGRALAAFHTGRYRIALSDVETLLELFPDRADLELMRGQLLVLTREYDEGIETLIAVANSGELSGSQLADAYEYQARAHYELGTAPDAAPDNPHLSAALTAIESALALEETATRHYYHGLILEAVERLRGATFEYEWLQFWSRFYEYPFADDVEARLEALARSEEE